MNKLKETITRKVQDLGESFMVDDINMEDMDEFVVSPYNIPSTSDEFPFDSLKESPSKAKNPAKSEDEIIESIDAAYFVDPDEFKAIDYELKKLYDIETCYEDISRERLKLKSQLSVISKKVAALIKEKTPSYGTQIVEMGNIREGLIVLIDRVQLIRRSLAVAKSQSSTCLGLIANEKKKFMLNRLRSSLLTIKTFYQTEHRIWEVIEEGKFSLALTMVSEAQDAAKEFLHINCVSDVMQKLSGMQSLLEAKLQDSFASLALLFDIDRYNLVYDAVIILKKNQNLLELILDSFNDALGNASTAVLINKLGKVGGKEDYRTLCTRIKNEDLCTVLNELGFVLSRTLYTFHSVIRFHSEKAASEEIEKDEGTINKNIVTSLHKQKETIFSIAEKKIELLIETRDFSTIKFDEVINIMDMITRFESIGKMYFETSRKSDLVDCVEKQLEIYFIRYHKDRMEELFMFIENESFTLCPVSFQFTIFDLQDFEFLRIAREEQEIAPEGSLMPQEWMNPFSQAKIKSRHQSTVSEPESGKDEDGILPPDKECPDSPILCNTALNLLRFFGRYIRITALLPSIASSTLPAVTQLFDFFLLAMCNIFESGNPETTESPARLSSYLQEIKRRLGEMEGKGIIPNFFLKKNEKRFQKINLPSVCPAVQIDRVESLFGAAERVIAIQSIEFVARQLDLLRPVLDLFYTDPGTELSIQMGQFFESVLPCAHSEVRLFLIDCITSRAINCKNITSMVSSTNWDISELRSQHSAYVDKMMKEFEVFSLRLSQIGDELLSDQIRRLLWQRTIYYAFKALIQGYCEGGKCSTEGRALMQLDFQNILIMLESISGLKPIPNASYVDSYIKAFYLPENDLESWVGNHNEYSSKQLLSLLAVAAHVSKKAKARIMSSLEK